MIIGIGCDIVEHATTIKLGWISNPVKCQRVLSLKEQNIHSLHPVNFISGRFAAKEAVLKCLRTGMQDGIPLTEIHILQSKNGQPFVELEGQVKLIADSLGIDSWQVSISHAADYSIAFVVAESL